MDNLDFVVDEDILISDWLSLIDDSLAWILFFLFGLLYEFYIMTKTLALIDDRVYSD